MNVKTIIIAVALVVTVGGATLLYNNLSGQANLPDLLGVHAAPQAAHTTAETEDTPEARQADDRFAAPVFTVEDEHGNDVKLSDFLGTPVVLNFWASWCPPCKAEMPDFNKAYEEMGDQVQFMMVDLVDGLRETKEKGAAYIAEEGFTFPVFYDMTQDAATRYGVRSIPTSIFIDSDGYIVAGVEGMIDESTLRRGIELAIAGAQ